MVYCNKCKKAVSEKEYEFSQTNFFKPLCRNCQPTPEARKLGILLKKAGWRIEFEKFDGYKSIDIAIVEARVNIEVDGSQHNLDEKQALADLKRTFYSFKKGFVTLRIPNSCLLYTSPSPRDS